MTILLSFVLAVSVTSCAGKGKKVAEEVMVPEQAEMKQDIAVIDTDRGVIKIKFFELDAPKTVQNFINLSKQGYYDGLTFHRVVKEPRPFVIQGGDPNGDGSGGPGYTIPAEFNARPHLEGTVAMARTEDPNSAGSQFYICLASQPQLDGKYTVFGQVIDGLENIHEIEMGDVIKTIKIEEVAAAK